jgi:hypothetical protein
LTLPARSGQGIRQAEVLSGNRVPAGLRDTDAQHVEHPLPPVDQGYGNRRILQDRRGERLFDLLLQLHLRQTARLHEAHLRNRNPAGFRKDIVTRLRDVLLQEFEDG